MKIINIFLAVSSSHAIIDIAEGETFMRWLKTDIENSRLKKLGKSEVVDLFKKPVQLAGI